MNVEGMFAKLFHVSFSSTITVFLALYELIPSHFIEVDCHTMQASRAVK